MLPQNNLRQTQDEEHRLRLNAERIVSNRVKSNSKGNYLGKINTIKLYLLSREDHVTLIDQNNEIIVPLSSGVVEDLFSWLSTNTNLPKKRTRRRTININDGDVDDDDQIIGDDDDVEEDDENNINNNADIDESIFAENSITISSSCMQGYKSALIWLYKEKRIPFSSDINNWCETFILGYKRNIADKKSRGIMSITEGKSPLSFQGYSKICEYFASCAASGKNFTWNLIMFAWVFMVFSWNLVGRSKSVGNLMLQHMDWHQDYIKLKLPMHKGDQTGEGIGNEKAIYANPYCPSICAINTLAIYIFSKYRGNNIVRQQLFEGTKSESRFRAILTNVLKTMVNLFPSLDLGAVIGDIGTHSNRKGAASYLLGFFFISAVNVYLRAGWSLGNVQDRYIFAGAGGDQIVGRAASGLPVNDLRFAVLPPHFSDEDTILLNAIGNLLYIY